uniref:Uncharacterized protein n=1 Tax=Anopheles coluzzii TaxID=1518534 RepID=A0A8W7PT50_ANOCL
MMRSGSFALYDRWHQRRCTPPVTPNPAQPPTKKPAVGKRAVEEKKSEMGVSNRGHVCGSEIPLFGNTGEEKYCASARAAVVDDVNETNIGDRCGLPDVVQEGPHRNHVKDPDHEHIVPLDFVFELVAEVPLHQVGERAAPGRLLPTVVVLEIAVDILVAYGTIVLHLVVVRVPGRWSWLQPPPAACCD